MKITTTLFKRCGLVKAVGRIDSETTPDLINAFNAIIKGGKSGIVFDMSEVDFISSGGLWVLLDTQKVCKKKKGKLTIANVTDKMSAAFELTGTKNFIEIYSNATDAVGSF